MIRRTGLVIGLVALPLVTGAGNRPAQNPARVDEIIQMLPSAPGVPGARPTDRTAWAMLTGQPEAKRIVAAAEAVCELPVPELPDELYLEFSQNGRRDRYERFYFERCRRLDNLVLAEALEWKGRFLPAIERILTAILKEKSWTVPAHDADLTAFKTGLPKVRLFSTQRAWIIAYALDWLGESLSPALVAAARAECRRRIIDPYLALCRSSNPNKTDGWFFGRSNWTAVCHAGAVSTALILCEDRRERAECIEAAERATPVYFAGFTDDGFCSEGMAYWEYGFGSYVALVLAVREATGGRVLLLSDTPKAARIASFVTAFQLESGLSPPFADGCGNPEPSALAMASMLWPDVFPRGVSDFPLLAGKTVNYGSKIQCAHTVALRAFVARPVAGRGLADGALPVRTAFSDAQVYILRPHQGVRGLSLAIKGGNNGENHNHNDLGGYAISLGGEILAGDPGCPPYTKKTFSSRRYEYDVLSSYGHSVPRIGSVLQSPGRTFQSRVLWTDFSALDDSVRMNLKGAYACAQLKRLERTFSFDRAYGEIRVTDEVELTEPMKLDFPVVTLANLEQDGDVWYLVGKRSRLVVTAEVSGGQWQWNQCDLDNAPSSYPRRLSVQLSEPVRKATVTVRFNLTAYDRGGRL